MLTAACAALNGRRAAHRPREEPQGLAPPLLQTDEGEALAEAPDRLAHVQALIGTISVAINTEEHLRLHVSLARLAYSRSASASGNARNRSQSASSPFWERRVRLEAHAFFWSRPFMKKALARRERGSRSIATPACAHLLEVAYGASPPRRHSWAPRAPLRRFRRVPSSNFGKKDLWYLYDFSSNGRALALRAQRSRRLVSARSAAAWVRWRSSFGPHE